MKIINKYTKEEMRCPVHKTSLIMAEQEVEYADELGRPIVVDFCRCSKCYPTYRWSVDIGDFFSMPVGYLINKSEEEREKYYTESLKARRRDFKDDKYAALGSPAKNSEIELYRKGLRKSYVFPSWLTFNLIQLFIHINYKADYNGNVLSKSYVLKYLYRDSGERGFNYLGAWPWDVWRFLWRHKVKRHHPEVKMFKTSLNTSWKYRWFEAFTKLRFYKLYLKYKKDGSITNIR